MSNTSLKPYLNEYALEAFFDMREDQKPCDRMRYMDAVLEGSVETNASLIQKLYTDILSRSNIDFGRIPESQGALTKYKDYKLMVEAIDDINRLYEGKPSQDVTDMNKLHDIIISCRKDYEFGYKFDVGIIKISYCVAVMSLYEMINICILGYTRQMRKDSGIEFDFRKIRKKDVIVVRGARSLIKCYESGQWARMVNDCKKDPGLFATAPATEAGFLGFDTVGHAIAAAQTAHPVIFTSVVVVAAIIGVLVAIRALVYFFYHNTNRIKNYIDTQKEFVDAYTRTEMDSGAKADVVEKHSQLSDKLQGMANYIEVRILKSDSDAKKDMAKTNATVYTKSEITQASPSSLGGDIEF